MLHVSEYSWIGKSEAFDSDPISAVNLLSNLEQLRNLNSVGQELGLDGLCRYSSSEIQWLCDCPTPGWRLGGAGVLEECKVRL